MKEKSIFTSRLEDLAAIELDDAPYGEYCLTFTHSQARLISEALRKNIKYKIHTPIAEDIEKEYQEFWKDIVEKNGLIDLEQIKKELFDFSFLMRQVPKVYCHITGNRMSYTTYYAEDVIRESDNFQEEQIEDRVKEELECQMEVKAESSQ